MKAFLLLITITVLASVSQANRPSVRFSICHEIDATGVRNLFSLWNNALATLNSSTVADRYSSRAVLLATVSDVPRNTRELIINYFDTFLLNKPQGVILSGDITIGCNWAKDAGIYEFTMGIDGSKVKARYSYVYLWENGQWLISHHHSSVLPEAKLAARNRLGKRGN